jgi:hypothetical protein
MMRRVPSWFAARIWYRLERLAWPGWLGLAMVAVAVIAIGAAAIIDRSNLDLEQALDRARDRLAVARIAGAGSSGVGSVRQFLDALPAGDEANRFIDSVQQEATQRGVAIDSAEYKAETLNDAKTVRLQVVAPARGEYRALRSWVDEVLRKNPSAALQELAVSREAEGGSALVARVRFILYMKAGS